MLPSLKLTFSPLKIGPIGKDRIPTSNHPFSGALVVSFREVGNLSNYLSNTILSSAKFHLSNLVYSRLVFFRKLPQGANILGYLQKFHPWQLSTYTAQRVASVKAAQRTEMAALLKGTWTLSCRLGRYRLRSSFITKTG